MLHHRGTFPISHIWFSVHVPVHKLKQNDQFIFLLQGKSLLLKVIHRFSIHQFVCRHNPKLESPLEPHLSHSQCKEKGLASNITNTKSQKQKQNKTALARNGLSAHHVHPISPCLLRNRDPRK